MVLTICRRYHDWEHFSSIRNLRGPHTGLPNIAETPPPADTEPESASLTAAKGPEKERKKEKAEAKPYNSPDFAFIEPCAPIKVKLKLPPSTCSEAEGDGEGAAGVDAEVDEDLTAKLPSTPSPISRPSSSPLLATATSSPSASAVLPEGLGHKARQKYPHTHHQNLSRGGGVPKPLTRRQRKVLGLPKARKELVVGAGSVPGGDGAAGAVSAGKIIIPGGKWKGRGSAPGEVGLSGGEDGEWKRNGTGRLDVRGFRELKI